MSVFNDLILLASSACKTEIYIYILVSDYGHLYQSVDVDKGFFSDIIVHADLVQ